MNRNHNPLILTFDIDGLYSDEVAQTTKILSILSKRNAFATFFITALHAQKHPELIDAILDQEHEVACHGYNHTTLADFSSEAFSASLKKATTKLQGIARKEIVGFRAPNFLIPRWAPKVLHSLGYKYDSSVQPSIPVPRWYGAPRAPLYPYCPSLENIYVKSDENHAFMEFPLAVFPRLRIPFGGWWARNLGLMWAKNALKKLMEKGAATLHFHPWEFEEKSLLTGMEQLHSFEKTLWFRNVGSHMYNVLEDILEGISSEKISIEMALKRDL